MTDPPTVTRHLGDHWGSAVRTRRDALGLSQADVAAACNVTQQTISKIEHGTLIPRDELKVLLAVQLETSPVHLFAWPALADLHPKAP